MEKRDKFLKIFANLPLPIRDEIILSLEEKPLTWNVAYIEIINDTPLSKEILEKLEKIGII